MTHGFVDERYSGLGLKLTPFKAKKLAQLILQDDELSISGLDLADGRQNYLHGGLYWIFPAPWISHVAIANLESSGGSYVLDFNPHDRPQDVAPYYPMIESHYKSVVSARDN